MLHAPFVFFYNGQGCAKRSAMHRWPCGHEAFQSHIHLKQRGSGKFLKITDALTKEALMVCIHDLRLVPGGQHPHPLTPSRKGRGNSHAVIFTVFSRGCSTLLLFSFTTGKDVPSEARCIDGLAVMRRFKAISLEMTREREVSQNNRCADEGSIDGVHP
jgi:hypothetical protein